MNFFTSEALCAAGRQFLADRKLSIPQALKMGVASKDGNIAFPFLVNGKIYRYKSRNMADKKLMSMSEIPPSLKNEKLPFWNQQNVPPGDYLIITEGEPDCIALAQLGESSVVSLPNGSSSVASVFKSQFAYLQKFKEIYLCFDMDEAGDKAVSEARGILPVEKFRCMRLPAKDANDWIKSEDATLDDLKKFMKLAERNHTEEIVLFKDLPKTFYEEIDLGTSTGWTNIDDHLGGIRTGELTIISADTGAGKTTFCINLLCNLLKNDSRGFWINSWEMDYKTIIRKVASVVFGEKMKYKAFSAFQIAKFEKWIDSNNVMLNPLKSKADMKSVRSQVELASRAYGVKYILFDHLDYMIGSGREQPEHEKIKDVVLELHSMALEFGVHIFLIAHPKQTDDKTGAIHMGQLKGSASIKQYADNILMIRNMQQANLSQPDPRVIVSIQKNRLLGSRGEVTLRYLPSSDSYVENLEYFNQE